MGQPAGNYGAAGADCRCMFMSAGEALQRTVYTSLRWNVWQLCELATHMYGSVISGFKGTEVPILH